MPAGTRLVAGQGRIDLEPAQSQQQFRVAERNEPAHVEAVPAGVGIERLGRCPGRPVVVGARDHQHAVVEAASSLNAAEAEREPTVRQARQAGHVMNVRLVGDKELARVANRDRRVGGKVRIAGNH